MGARGRRRLIVCAFLAWGLMLPGIGGAAPSVGVSVFARTGRGVDSIVWTGTQFLYVVNTKNTVYAAPPAGLPLRLFATMKRLVEETRCVLSPGTHGFPRGVIFCHSPDNRIYEISSGGSQLRVFATLPAPYPPPADGALTFDSLGRFGYQLVAATGRSGDVKVSGGALYTISSTGTVRDVGRYAGPGGADEVMIAPANFGPLAGQALLTVDAGARGGRLVEMDARGKTRSLASFPGDGPNPILEIPVRVATRGIPAPGIYLTDDETKDVYYVSAAQLTAYAGDLFVSTEDKAEFWIFAPDGASLRAIPLSNALRHRGHGLEGAIYIP